MVLSFVLPFTFHERVANNLHWRHNPDEGAEERFTLLLRSFVALFDQTALHEFVILSPLAECSRTEELLRTITSDVRYKVIPEHIICELMGKQNMGGAPINGWHAQQMLKMAVAQHLSTPFYLTLDSDNVCLRHIGCEDFLESISKGNNRGFANVETPEDYSRIYKDMFAAVEIDRKNERYSSSAELIGYMRFSQYVNQFYGETPCVIHTESMKALLNHLESRFPASWQEVLAASSSWTEYGLYFQFLEMSGELERLYSLKGCNKVLDLERSVWQENIWYRRERIYDRVHFTEFLHAEARGPLVAIQSWLPVESWLPKRYNSLGEFYGEMSRWLFTKV